MILKRKPKNFTPKFEVVGCYCQHENKILFLKRHAEKMYGNHWNLPAGKVEEGETHEDAVIREVLEETGIELSPTNLTSKHSYIVRYPEYDYYFHTFKATVSSKTVKLKLDEAQEHGWFELTEALKLELVPDEDYCIKDAFGI